MGIIKLNNRGMRSATDIGGTTSLGTWTLIKKLTASSSATLAFVDGSADVDLDDTYREYLFTFNNIHPATDATSFGFNVSIDGGSNYNVAKTTTMVRTQHYESGTSGVIEYVDLDLAQGTGTQFLHQDDGMGADNDQCLAGYLHLFEPSNTTFVKHFMSLTSNINASDRCRGAFVSGYANTTSAVNAVQFLMAADEIDAGDICLYGLN